MTSKHFRCALSWFLYGIGKIAFLLIDRCTWGDDKDEPGWLWHRTYDTYQWCMIKSSDLDTGHCDLWTRTAQT